MPNKNFRELGRKPLVNWTVLAAVGSGLFNQIWLCTDAPAKAVDAICSCDYREWFVFVLRQKHPLHRDDCKDIEWVSDALTGLKVPEDSSIYLLRPTSPFRGPETIKRAHDQWEACKDRLDSLRAVRKSTEHPFKQWIVEDDKLKTMCPITTAAAKKHLHSFPTQSLTPAYVQTAALEVFSARTVYESGTIAGQTVGMFLCEGPETLDINTPEDWWEAERHLERETSAPQPSEP